MFLCSIANAQYTPFAFRTTTITPVVIVYHYVSTSGNDANDGLSPSTPWKTLDKVNSHTFGPGDWILFKGGETFTGQGLRFLNDSGTAINPIVITSYGTGNATISNAGNDSACVKIGNGLGGFAFAYLNIVGDYNPVTQTGTDTTITNNGFEISDYLSGHSTPQMILIARVNISGFSQSGFNYNADINHGHVVVSLDECNIYNCGVFGIKISNIRSTSIGVYNCSIYNILGRDGTGSSVNYGYSGSGIYLSNMSFYRNYVLTGNSIYNCGEYADIGSNGISIDNCNYIRLYHNQVYGIKSNTSFGNGISLQSGTDSCIVQYNYIHNIDGSGIEISDLNSTSSPDHNIIRYCIIKNAGLKNNKSGLSISSNTYQPSYNYIYNNTIVLKRTNSSIPSGISLLGRTTINTTIKNNIFLGDSTKQIVLDSSNHNSLFFQYNNYWDSSDSYYSIKWGSNTYTSLNAWQTATNQEKVSDVSVMQYGNPRLQNPFIGLDTLVRPYSFYSLPYYYQDSGSVCYNTGTNLDSIFLHLPADIYGVTVPQFLITDIGVSENSVEYIPPITEIDTHKVYYISSAGNDNNNGLTPLTPWRTLNKITFPTLLLNPGDTVRFKGEDQILGFAYLNTEFDDNDKKIVFNSYGTGKATLQISPTDSRMFYINFNKTGVIKYEFKNLIFRGNYDAQIQSDTTNLRAIYITSLAQVNVPNDSMHLVIDSCEFSRFSMESFRVEIYDFYKRGYYRITNNKFHDIGLDGFFMAGIVYSDFEISDNRFERINGRFTQEYTAALSMYSIKKCLITNNYINDIGKYSSIGGTGIYVGGSKSITMRKNEVTLTKINSVEGYGLYGDCGCDSMVFEYNYIHNAAAGIMLAGGPTAYCSPVVSVTMPGLLDDSAQASYNIARFNIITNNGIGSHMSHGIAIYSPNEYVNRENQYAKRNMIYNNLFYLVSGKRFIDTTIRPRGYLWPNQDTIKKSIDISAAIYQFGRSDSIYIYNNIFVLDSAIAIYHDTTGNSYQSYARNWFVRNNIYWQIDGKQNNINAQRVAYTYYWNPADSNFRYYKYFWPSLKNWSDVTGMEKNGGTYTYYNYNPYIKDIKVYNTEVNTHYFDTLNNFKTLDISVAKNNGINFNSEVSRIADTVTVDFYGQPYVNDIGINEIQDSYDYQPETQRWLGRDTALLDYTSGIYRRLLDTGIVKNLKTDTIWTKLEDAYLMANEKLYIARLNMIRDTNNLLDANFIGGYSFVPDSGIAMFTNGYINTGVSVGSYNNSGFDFYTSRELYEEESSLFGVYNSGVAVSYDVSYGDGASYIDMFNSQHGNLSYSYDNFFGTIFMQSLNNTIELVQNGDYVSTISVNEGTPSGSIYLFALNDNNTATRFTNQRLGYYSKRLPLTATQLSKLNIIIKRYMNYITASQEGKYGTYYGNNYGN